MNIWLLLLAQIGLLFVLSRSLDRWLSMSLHRLLRSDKAVVWVMAILFLPGTALHELSHLLVAWLLLVKAYGLTLIPKFEGGGIVMGSVQVPKVDRVRSFIIGVAPVMVGLSGLWLLSWMAVEQGWLNSLPGQLLVGYGVFQIANTMFASKADMQGAVGLFVFIGLLVGLGYWLGLRISMEWIVPWLMQYEEVFAQASWWLWWPIAIDAVMLLVLWALNPRG